MGTARVAVAIEDAHLEATLQDQMISNGSWLYFTVTFDPTKVSRDRVEAAIKAGGGKLVAGPP